MNVDLTHPEFLTIEQLQVHLKDFVGSDVPSDKYELVQLFYKYVAPLPQRKFRANRLGALLTSNQKKYQGEKRSLTNDVEDIEKSCKSKLKLTANGSTTQPHGVKHESDRGIYTIKMNSSASKSTPPIKIKRPSVTPTTNDDTESNKRMKLDETGGS